LEEKIDRQMELKADQKDVDRLSSDINCIEQRLCQQIKESEERTIKHIGERIGDLQKIVLQHLNKN
jgi:hypothetical protein